MLDYLFLKAAGANARSCFYCSLGWGFCVSRVKHDGISNDAKREIKALIDNYRNSSLHKARNKIIDHKSRDSIGDPFMHFMNPIKSTFIDEAESFINDLSIVMQEHFNAVRNNDLKQHLDAGFLLLLKSIEHSLETAKADQD